jgi:AraC-like DNA-binding protein
MMEGVFPLLILTEEQCVDQDTGVHCNWHESMVNISHVPHAHEFYEIFMLTEGEIIHVVNGVYIPLQKGDIVLIRPNDSHTYKLVDDRHWRLINLTFTKDVMYTLLHYLGIDRLTCPLIAAGLPPHIHLTPDQQQERLLAWDRLTSIPGYQKQQIRQFARTLIADIIMHLFLPTLPVMQKKDWFEQLISDMSLPENYIPGISRMKKLAPCSYEHVCRRFRQTFGRSPSDWINEQRVYYAANLLKCSNKSALDIAAESGFENPSYFYALFKKYHGVTPAQHRQREQRTVIPSAP